MTRARLLFGAFAMAATLSGSAFAQTASDCAKVVDPKKKDECVRSLQSAGKSGTQPAQPADPRGSGPATPAVPGKAKGR
jgi:hypothetical protein